MTTSMMRGARLGLVLWATGAIFGGGAGAAAQQPSRLPPGAVVQPLEDPQGAELRRHLQTLADNPHSVDALIGAGRAALRTGDPDAALSFFGRADELAPRDARVKAGMAAAMVQMGQAQTALALFAEAAALGAPEAEIAGDRGLAFDMTGDPRRAQQDYTLSLRHRDDDEVRRRMALSLAITGQRDAALRLIDPQLRRRDRAAWRTQAFVLALTGDSAGASRTAESVMPAGTAQAMAPFLARLASLDPAQKAMAVHLGQFPSSGGSRSAAASPSADPNAVALAMGGPPPATAAQPRPSQTTTTTTTTRRRPEPARDSSDPYGLRGVRRGAPPQPATRQPQTEPPQTAQRQPVQQPAAEPRQQPPPAETEPPQTAQRQPAAEPRQPPPAEPEPPPVQSRPAPTEVATVSTPAPVEPSPEVTLPPSARQSAPAEPQRRGEPLADIEALVEALPDEPASRPAAPPPAQPQRRTEPVRTAQAQPPAQRPARPRASRPAHPSRHWVQIAGGANRAALPREFARVREAAPEELRGRSGWVAATATSNRLLLGPFATSREAQNFVNRLARRNVAAFAWTSAAGQEIERLQSR